MSKTYIFAWKVASTPSKSQTGIYVPKQYELFWGYFNTLLQIAKHQKKSLLKNTKHSQALVNLQRSQFVERNVRIGEKTKRMVGNLLDC